MAVPSKNTIRNINTLSLTDDSSIQNAIRPVPKPRTSKGIPNVTKRTELSTGKETRVVSTRGSQVPTNNTLQLSGIEENKKSLIPQISPRIKRVDIKTKKSYSGESLNESLKYLQTSESRYSENNYLGTQTVGQHKSTPNCIQSIQIVSPESYSKSDTDKKTKARQPRKTVQIKGGKLQSEQSTEYENFVKQQGLELCESLQTESSQETKGRPPTRQVVFDSDGKKQVVLSSDFEEYTISTLRSLSDTNYNTKSLHAGHKPKTNHVSIKNGKREVSYSNEYEDYSSQSLVNLREISSLENTQNSDIPTRQVTSHVSFVDGTKRYSSEFESYAQSHGLQGSREFYSETDLETITKSRDKDITSWIEVKQGKRQVKLSDEFENVSLGPTIEYTSKGKENHGEIYKTVAYRDGKRHVSYSDEFLNTLSYTDDFESSANSWAVKIRRNSEQSPVTKRVEYRDGKKHITYSSDVDDTYLRQETIEDDFGSSFTEIALEDLEDHSYTEDFESATAKGYSTARSVTSAVSVPSVDNDDTEVWSSSTHTPLTSIHTSIQQFTEDKGHTLTPRDTGLYSESYETVTSLPQSDTYDYSITEDTSVLSSPRHRANYDVLTKTESIIDSESEEDTYTMTFTQPTVESVEESPEIKKKTEIAKEAFLKKKLAVLKKPTKSRYIPPPMNDKLSGAEAKHFNKFIKSKIKVIENKGSVSPIKSESTRSARNQLRGINLDEPVEKYGISSSVIARLKMENTMHNIKMAAQEELHDPYKCDKCSDNLGQHAARQFMWNKKAIVSEKLVHEKMEMQMLQLQDPVWLYAEALRGLPKLTDHPDDVYYKLMKPLYDSYAVNATNYQDSVESV